jgi:hypothetical protein
MFKFSGCGKMRVCGVTAAKDAHALQIYLMRGHISHLINHVPNWTFQLVQRKSKASNSKLQVIKFVQFFIYE